ncbi:MAG: hypothetical protein MAGBODY4_01382 [Candidatus Marinimicrobia bacterium]|nr:hypothetical protein [Candidatus Neomarinimicrobiota bacterium]
MERQHKLELIVGATVLFAIAVVIAVILWGRGALFDGRTQEITMKFNQVGGLTPSDVVSVSGVNVGRVKTIRIEQDSVVVTARIEKDVPLRRDAKAAIVNAELMGGKKIDLKPGKSQESFPEEKIIIGDYVPGIMDLAGVLENREGDLNTLLSDLIVTVRSLKELLGNGQEEEGDLRTVMENLASTTARVDTLMKVNEVAIRRTLDNLEESSKILRNFMGSEERRAKALLAAGETLSGKLNTLSDSTQILLNKMNDPSTTVGKLVRDDSLYYQVSHAAVSLDSLLTDIRENPKKYLNVKVSPF